MSGSRRRTGKPRQVRIIGGKWRGRKLAFDPAEGLRPTGDRIRETLFNWLTADIEGARCADLFAGSGALGLEALSRGAAHCDFVDSSRAVTDRVAGYLESLDAQDRGTCHTCTAQRFLETAARPFDIVFIDPPFRLELARATCRVLAGRALVRDGGLVYLESDAHSPGPETPAAWQLYRDKVAGGVAYRLFRVTVRKTRSE
jgi:16S rRNA (guanine966-N2)-methyltransferase